VVGADAKALPEVSTSDWMTNSQVPYFPDVVCRWLSGYLVQRCSCSADLTFLCAVDSLQAPTLFDFINLGFARPSINKFGAAQELGDRETALGDLLACPQQVRRRSDEDELQWEDVIDDPDKFSSESVDDDIVDASERRSVPINRQQFAAIKRIGCDRIALIQGPPGTGKSTTIFNAIKYRLPPLKQAIVTAVTNQVGI
jgi:hypothetical protein